MTIPASPTPSAPPRLLLVDDDPALAAFIADAAELSGFVTRTASDSAQFEIAFDEARPAMVVLDLGLPGQDGIELLRRLAQGGFDGPVLIVSGFDERVLDSAMRLGAAQGLRMVGPVRKPMRLAELEALLAPLAAQLGGSAAA